MAVDFIATHHVAKTRRCMLRDNLEEHFSIHEDGLNILAVNCGPPRACPYPRQSKLPAKWSFVWHAVFKNSELAPRTTVFTEDALIGDNGEVEVAKPPERSFWVKHWMYLIPLGLTVVNAMTQAMNIPEDGAGGQGQQGTAPSSSCRREKKIMHF